MSVRTSPLSSDPEICAMEMLLDAEWSEVNQYFIWVGEHNPFPMRLYDRQGNVIAEDTGVMENKDANSRVVDT